MKDAKPNASGISVPKGSSGPMAVASVEENVKLKDLWQAKYTVAMLKSMKTVTFETPSGNHAYTVVMVVYSTQCVCVCVLGR